MSYRVERIAEHTKKLLEILAEEYGLDLEDENFKGTPERVGRMYEEIFAGLGDTEKKVEEILDKAFPCSYSQIVLARNVRAYSVCPHHLLPVEYDIDVAYIPEPGGKVLGISKLSRLAVLLARRPVLQEQLTEDITDALMRIQGASGAACIVRGRHFCMIMRGVKQYNSVTVTSSMKGVFMEDPATRNELMNLLKVT